MMSNFYHEEMNNSDDDDDRSSSSSEVAPSPKKKRIRKPCSVDGCSSNAVSRGVCVRHGAPRTYKICTVEGCTNQVVRSGVCQRHGAKVAPRRPCSVEGCTTPSKSRGLCRRHGAPYKKERNRRRCSAEGCTSQVYNMGVCIKHGGVQKRCSHEGCPNKAVKGGICMRHGAKQTICKHEGCTNYAQLRGLCHRHGAPLSRCSEEGCSNLAIRKGLCCRHGGGPPPCNHEGCTSQSVQGGRCARHAVGKPASICFFGGCCQRAKIKGLCRSHFAMVAGGAEDGEEGAGKSEDAQSGKPDNTIDEEDEDEDDDEEADNSGNFLDAEVVDAVDGELAKLPPLLPPLPEATVENDDEEEQPPPKKHTKLCSVEGCTNPKKQGGLCYGHGARQTVCKHEGCTKYAQLAGLCYRHGDWEPKYCNVEGCTNKALRRGVCQRHGGGPKICSVDGCTVQSQRKGLCPRHIRDINAKKCSFEGGCIKWAQTGEDLCKGHIARLAAAAVMKDNEISSKQTTVTSEEGDSWTCICGNKLRGNRKRCSCLKWRNGKTGKGKSLVTRPDGNDDVTGEKQPFEVAVTENEVDDKTPADTATVADAGAKELSQSSNNELSTKQTTVMGEVDDWWRCTCGQEWPGKRKRCSCQKWRNGRIGKAKSLVTRPDGNDGVTGEKKPFELVATEKEVDNKTPADTATVADAGAKELSQSSNNKLSTKQTTVIGEVNDSWTCTCGQEWPGKRKRCSCQKWRYGRRSATKSPGTRSDGNDDVTGKERAFELLAVGEKEVDAKSPDAAAAAEVAVTEARIYTLPRHDWYYNYGRLKEYQAAYGNVNVPAGHTLYTWVENQKVFANNLSLAKFAALQKLGVVFPGMGVLKQNEADDKRKSTPLPSQTQQQQFAPQATTKVTTENSDWQICSQCAAEGAVNFISDGAACMKHGPKVTNNEQARFPKKKPTKSPKKKTAKSLKKKAVKSPKIKTTKSPKKKTAKSTKKKSLPNELPPEGSMTKNLATKCTHEGCTNNTVKGDLCFKHCSAPCSYEGCTNRALNTSGFCRTHGAQVAKKVCTHEGCTNGAIRRGRCAMHEVKPKYRPRICNQEGCKRHALAGGLCRIHGGKPKLCKVDDCPNQVSKHGLCCRHGGRKALKLCSADGCTNQRVRRGFCTKHGGANFCSFEGCPNQSAKQGGLCQRHWKSKTQSNATGMEAILEHRSAYDAEVLGDRENSDVSSEE